VPHISLQYSRLPGLLVHANGCPKVSGDRILVLKVTFGIALRSKDFSDPCISTLNRWVYRIMPFSLLLLSSGAEHFVLIDLSAFFSQQSWP
jgi:hypothetical protein